MFWTRSRSSTVNRDRAGHSEMKVKSNVDRFSLLKSTHKRTYAVYVENTSKHQVQELHYNNYNNLILSLELDKNYSMLSWRIDYS